MMTTMADPQSVPNIGIMPILLRSIVLLLKLNESLHVSKIAHIETSVKKEGKLISKPKFIHVAQTL